MKWKEFLKPTKEKAILIAIIVIISIIIYILKPYNNIILSILFWPLESIFHINFPRVIPIESCRPESAECTVIGAILTAPLISLGFIFSIIWIYFLSCIIIGVYNKFKRRNVNERNKI